MMRSIKSDVMASERWTSVLYERRKHRDQFAGAGGQYVIGEEAHKDPLQAGTEGWRTHRLEQDFPPPCVREVDQTLQPRWPVKPISSSVYGGGGRVGRMEISRRPK